MKALLITLVVLNTTTQIPNLLHGFMDPSGTTSGRIAELVFEGTQCSAIRVQEGIVEGVFESTDKLKIGDEELDFSVFDRHWLSPALWSGYVETGCEQRHGAAWFYMDHKRTKRRGGG